MSIDQNSGMIVGMRRLYAAALACAGCALLLAPALSFAHPDDTRATRAYLRASGALAKRSATELRASATALEARAEAIAAECPAALTYAPRDAALDEIGEEAHQTLLDAGAEQTLGARRAFAHAVERLRWSSRRLTRLVHEHAAEELAPATAALPHVCADIDAWQASAYATVPQSTTAFLGHGNGEPTSALGRLLALFVHKPTVGGLLRQFENARETRIARRIEREEQQTSSVLTATSSAAAAKLAAMFGISAL
jgi:hypothetical protein